MAKTFAQELKQKSENFLNETNISLEEKERNNKEVIEFLKKELERVAELGETKAIFTFIKKPLYSCFSSNHGRIYQPKYVVQCLQNLGLIVSYEIKSDVNSFTSSCHKKLRLEISWE